MNAYHAYIYGRLLWTHIEARSEKACIDEVKKRIENLHPLNMSDEGIEEYRNRFRGKPITCTFKYEVKTN